MSVSARATDNRFRRTYLLVVAAWTSLMIFSYGAIDYAGRFAHVDLQYYREMAQAAPGLALDVPKPFAYRVLGPYLVGLLPVPDPWGFYVVSATALIALTVLFYAFLRKQGIYAAPAAFATALLTMNPYIFGFLAFNYFQLGDTLSLVGLVAALWTLYRRQWMALALILLLGALTRETMMLMLPVGAAYLWERNVLREHGGYLGAAVAPALVSFIALRVGIHSDDGLMLWQALYAYADQALLPETWYRLLINAYAPLSVLPLFFWRRTRAFFCANQHLLLLVLLVVASCFFGGDQERLMAPAFIAFYSFMALLLHEVLLTRWTALVLGACAFITSLHHLTARYPLPDRRLTIALSLSALLIVSVMAGWYARTCGPPQFSYRLDAFLRSSVSDRPHP